MNKIEEKFSNAFCSGFNVDCIEKIPDKFPDFTEIHTQFRAGIYIADFAFFSNYEKFIIEIDGQESHKTKEQRFKDYQRERFFQKEGFIIIRFTGSEVFVDPKKCVKEAFDIMFNYMSNLTAHDINEKQKEDPYFLSY